VPGDSTHPSSGGRPQAKPRRQAIRVLPTDERLAKLVGAILHDTGSGSERLADAHVVAACATSDMAIVLTVDPSDVAALATALPGVRIVTRNPASPL